MYTSGRQAPNRDRLYGRRWREASRTYLRQNPLCRYCQQMGRLVTATVVDHITPHRGDAGRFWDANNWQPLCKRCHDSVKAKEEAGGRRVGCDVNGFPLDADHHWHRGG